MTNSFIVEIRLSDAQIIKMSRKLNTIEREYSWDHFPLGELDP